MRRARVAPIARRMATSRCRVADRARIKLARLTQAMRRTKPTAASSTSADRRISGSTRASCSDIATAPYLATGPRIGNRLVDALTEKRDSALGLFLRDARLPPRHRVVRMRPLLVELVGGRRHERHPDAGLSGQAAEPRRQNADDRMRDAAEPDGLPEHGGLTTEAALPQVVAEQDDRLDPGGRIFC